MDVNTCFYRTSATTSLIWPAEAPYHGAELIFMHSFRCPPEWETIILPSPPISSSKMSKTGKTNLNFILSVITQKNPLYFKSQNFHEIYTYLFFLIVKFEPIISNISKFIAC